MLFVFEVFYKGIVKVNYGIFYFVFVEVEIKGIVLFDGVGYQVVIGFGVGLIFVDSVGFGGGFGGYGGQFYNNY